MNKFNLYPTAWADYRHTLCYNPNINIDTGKQSVLTFSMRQQPLLWRLSDS